MKREFVTDEEVKRRCENYAILYEALERLGITKKDDVRYREISGRIEVTVNGKYYGIWDTERRTFVD